MNHAKSTTLTVDWIESDTHLFPEDDYEVNFTIEPDDGGFNIIDIEVVDPRDSAIAIAISDQCRERLENLLAKKVQEGDFD